MGKQYDDVAGNLTLSQGGYGTGDWGKMAHKLPTTNQSTIIGVGWTNNYSTRDVSARNCLVGDKLVVKLSDFGMSRETAGQGKNYYKKVSSCQCQCLSGVADPITLG